MACSNAYIIKLGLDEATTEIAGQLDGTLTVGGTRVENTNKSNGGAISYVQDCIVGKQVVFAGNFTLISDTAQNTIKAAIEAGQSLDATVVGVDGELWAGLFAPSGRSDSAPLNADSTMAITFSSDGANGVYAYTAPTAP